MMRSVHTFGFKFPLWESKKTNKHINIGLISNAINRNIEKVKYNRFYIKHTNHQLNSITNMFELIQWFNWKNIGEDRR